MDAVYYPDMQARDRDWLLGALLFWEKIVYLVPASLGGPRDDVSQELIDAGALEIHNLDPTQPIVESAGEQIIAMLEAADAEGFFGRDHWALQQASEGYLHVDKLTDNVRCSLEGMYSSRVNEDGFLAMPESLAGAYMIVVATQLARERGLAVVTDDPSAHRLSTDAVFRGQHRRGRGGRVRGPDFDRRREQYVDMCVSELLLSWLRVGEEVPVSAVVEFRRKNSELLSRMREALSGLVPPAGYNDDIRVLREDARRTAEERLAPALTEFRARLDEARWRTLPSDISAEIGLVLGGLALQLPTTALVALPTISLVVRSIKCLRSGAEQASESHWSYLHKACAALPVK